VLGISHIGGAAIATSAVAPRVDIERRFFTGMVVAMALTTFIGFAPSYFLRPFIGIPPFVREVPVTPWIHLHAVSGSAWMLFLIWQAYLIRGKQHQRHMANGLIGASIALVVIAVGLVVAFDAAREGRNPPGWTSTSFLMIPLATTFLFGGFVAAALWYRRRPDYHKRFILIGTTAALLPATARISMHWFRGILPPVPLGGLILSDLFLLALVAYDLKKLGRLHPATLWGGGFMLLSQPLRVMVARTDEWNAFAARLIG
jgi:hypothetical protein